MPLVGVGLASRAHAEAVFDVNEGDENQELLQFCVTGSCWLQV